MVDYSNIIVYVDESGDHGLVKCDPDYPIFVLAFCVVQKKDYTQSIIPSIKTFKFKHFGHDVVVLHEHEIRKATGDFAFLKNADVRQAFMDDLSEVIAGAPFVVFAVVIRKDKLTTQTASPANPYHLAMRFGLEKLNEYLGNSGQSGKTTHIAFERRGRKEDAELELEFRRVCDGQN